MTVESDPELASVSRVFLSWCGFRQRQSSCFPPLYPIEDHDLRRHMSFTPPNFAEARRPSPPGVLGSDLNQPAGGLAPSRHSRTPLIDCPKPTARFPTSFDSSCASRSASNKPCHRFLPRYLELSSSEENSQLDPLPIHTRHCPRVGGKGRLRGRQTSGTLQQRK